MTGPQDPSSAADPIIVHPDIRRMLLTQKAIAEGGRMMIYTCALLSDQAINYMNCLNLYFFRKILVMFE